MMEQRRASLQGGYSVAGVNSVRIVCALSGLSRRLEQRQLLGLGLKP